VTPKEVVLAWVERFNAADVDGLAALYAPDAVNHQVVTEPLHGRDAIRRLFEVEFGRATMTCLVENLFECGDWAILEWKDPLGLRGCGFFRIENDRIAFQRGYFDRMSFFEQQGIAPSGRYLGDE
jgi:limonene-1,2-epoxide hydrolase